MGIKDWLYNRCDEHLVETGFEEWWFEIGENGIGLLIGKGKIGIEILVGSKVLYIGK